MPCEEIIITDIDQMLYEKLLAEANAANVKFDGTKAEIVDGVFAFTLDWNYDVPTRTLHVTCIKKPLLVSCTAVESRIRQLVEKAKVAI